MGYYFPFTGLLFVMVAAIILDRQAARLEIVRVVRFE
jgi:hypothetical protein